MSQRSVASFPAAIWARSISMYQSAFQANLAACSGYPSAPFLGMMISIAGTPVGSGTRNESTP